MSHMCVVCFGLFAGPHCGHRMSLTRCAGGAGSCRTAATGRLLESADYASLTPAALADAAPVLDPALCGGACVCEGSVCTLTTSTPWLWLGCMQPRHGCSLNVAIACILEAPLPCGVW